MKGRPTNPESIRQLAVKLTEQLGIPVTVGQVRYWRKKGYDLNDPDRLTRSLLNQKRPPKGLKRRDKPEERVQWIPVDVAARREDDLVSALAEFIPDEMQGLPKDQMRAWILAIGVIEYEKLYGELLGNSAEVHRTIRDRFGSD